MSVIRADKLSRYYGQVMGLNGVSVEIASGITGLLGPNGAGKSTFLWLMTGQLRPSEGTIEVYDRNPWRNPRLFNRVGFCPELEEFYRDLSAFEFVTLLARLSGMRRRAAKDAAAKTLEAVGMTDHMHRRMSTYSRGMRQRTKLAQALVHDPDLLILDEPLAGMDPVGRRDILGLIRRLGQSGKDILLASHVLHEVESVTSRILLINRGRILAEGDVSEIRALIDRHPHHVRVDCDRPRELAGTLVRFDDVVRVAVEPGEDGLLVETKRPDDFYARLPGVLVEGKYDVTRIESQDDNLAAVFKYLTE